jgi:hypothetical protein
MMLNKLLAAAALAGILGFTTAYAQAPEVLNPPVKTTAKKKTKKAKTTTASKSKFLPGSQETTKERATRLQRECKGGVDAGACAGYTR